MKITTLLLLASLSLFAAPHASAAGLRFEQAVITVAGDGTSDVFPFTFCFVNEGSKPVRITAVRPACGCTTAELPRELYGPGEAGELTAVLKTVGMRGGISKDIVLETDEGADGRYTLTMRVEIHEAVQVAPRLVYWMAGEAPAPKVVTIRFATPEAGRIVSAHAADEVFQITKREWPDQTGLSVEVTPRSTQQARQSELVLTVETAAGGRLEQRVYLRVFPRPGGIDAILDPTKAVGGTHAPGSPP
jgi:Protein of unknown function (DUF1573)